MIHNSFDWTSTLTLPALPTCIEVLGLPTRMCQSGCVLEITWKSVSATMFSYFKLEIRSIGRTFHFTSSYDYYGRGANGGHTCHGTWYGAKLEDAPYIERLLECLQTSKAHSDLPEQRYSESEVSRNVFSYISDMYATTGRTNVE